MLFGTSRTRYNSAIAAYLVGRARLEVEWSLDPILSYGSPSSGSCTSLRGKRLK